jgi:hypothetical protein
MGIILVINNQCPTQTITVLVPQVTMIPECTLKRRGIELANKYDMNNGPHRLVRDFEDIMEAFARHNGTLGDKGSAIGVVGVLLEKAVPML